MMLRNLANSLFALLLLPALAFGQLPSPALDFVFPAGGQTGSKLTVQVSGRDLDDATGLWFSHPGMVSRPVMRDPGEFETEKQVVPHQFEVEIPINVPPGNYDVRVVGRFGASTPRTFCVGMNPEVAEAGSHQVPEQAMALPLDTVVNGRADGGAIDYYRFSAKSGQTLVVECLSQQVDSVMQPVVTIFDAQGNQLLRSRRLLDPVLKFTAPAEGDYLLGVHDHVYAGGNSHFYRLCIHSGPYLVASSPTIVEPGKTNYLHLFGANLPGGEANAELRLDNMPLERTQMAVYVPDRAEATKQIVVTKPVVAAVDSFSLQLPGANGGSNALAVGFADHPVVAEVEPNSLPSQAQEISVPCSVAGRFFPRRDQDWVVFPAQAGQEFQIRVASHRMGHPTDPEVFVQRVIKQADGSEQVSQVTTNDDFRADNNRYRQGIRRGLDISHRDPSVRFRADQDAMYRIGLRDLNGSSVDDPRLTYELIVEPLRPDFQLLAWTQRPAANDDKNIDRRPLAVRRSGQLPVLLDLMRVGGFDGPVQVSVSGLPTGVHAAPCVMGPGQNEAILTITAEADAPAWHGAIQITGEAIIHGSPRFKPAQEAFLIGNTGNIEQARPDARLARQMLLSVIDREQAPVELAWNSQTPASGFWETCVGAKLTIPLTLSAHQELKSEVAVTPYGVPDKAKAEPVTLKSDAPEAAFTLTLDSNEIQPGTYTLLLRGKAKTAYARNPEAIAAAEKARSEFNQTLADLDTKIAAAAEAVAQAKQADNQRSEQLAAWTSMQQEAAQAFEAARGSIVSATEKLAGIEQQARSSASERATKLNEVAAEAQQAAEKIRAELESAQSVAKRLADELGQLQSQATAAQSQVAELENNHQALTQKKERAMAFVQQLDQNLENTRKNFGPADLDAYVHAPALTVKIHRTPVEVKANLAQEATLAQGSQLVIPVNVTRRFDFSGPVSLSLAAAGVEGLAAESVTLAEDASECQLVVTADKATPLGKHQAMLKISVKFNNLDLSEEVPLTLNVVSPAEDASP